MVKEGFHKKVFKGFDKVPDVRLFFHDMSSKADVLSFLNLVLVWWGSVGFERKL